MGMSPQPSSLGAAARYGDYVGIVLDHFPGRLHLLDWVPTRSTLCQFHVDVILNVVDIDVEVELIAIRVQVARDPPVGEVVEILDELLCLPNNLRFPRLAR